MTKNPGSGEKQKIPSTFRERMLFVIWYAGKKLGTDDYKEFARAIDRSASQLSKWVNENPKPNWESIKAIATAVALDPVWLDDPAQQRAQPPEEFEEWLAPRRAKQAADARTRRAARS